MAILLLFSFMRRDGQRGREGETAQDRERQGQTQKQRSNNLTFLAVLLLFSFLRRDRQTVRQRRRDDAR